MANERDEDLSELDDAGVLDRVRELVEDGWKPQKLTLTRDQDPQEENPVLRDEPRF